MDHTLVVVSADTGGFLGHDGKYHCKNDMGFLGSAGRDPLFYSHHANVDRMWHVWSTKLGGEGFKDPEWLDASFVFYDDVENPRPVRIKFRDVLDTRNLGYTYDPEAEKDTTRKPPCRYVIVVTPLQSVSTSARKYVS